MEVERLFLYDHIAEDFKFILSPITDGTGSSYNELNSEVKKVWENIYRILQRHRGKNKNQPVVGQPITPQPSNGLKSNLSEADYTERVEKAKSYIQEGDIYQANIAQKFET